LFGKKYGPPPSFIDKSDKTMRKYLLLLISVVLASCSTPISKGPTVVSLAKAFPDRQPINLSEIATKVEYVPLETSDSCLIGNHMSISTSANYIIAVDSKQMLLFDRKTGKFVRKIGQYGKGPGDFSRTDEILPYDGERETLAAYQGTKRYTYSLDGKLQGEVGLPGMIFTAVRFGNDYLGYKLNFTGKEKTKLELFDSTGTSVKTYPNYLTFVPDGDGITIWKPHHWFYRLQGQLYFYELFNDTLFQATRERLIPTYVFGMGRFAPPYAKQLSTEYARKEMNENFRMISVFESPRYLFYNFAYEKKVYASVYDKQKGEVQINDGTERNAALVNDLDHFVPVSLAGVNQEDQLVGYADAYRLVQWFQEHPDKTGQLPPELQKLKSRKETDNPVVMIAKLKNL